MADQVDRIARIAFETARKRGGKLCSVDKANVLEVHLREQSVHSPYSHAFIIFLWLRFIWTEG